MSRHVQVLSAPVLALVMLLVAAAPLRADDAPKPQKDLADLLRDKPMIDPEFLRQHTAGLDGKSEAELREINGRLQKIHTVYRKYWDQLQATRYLRRVVDDAYFARSANYVLQMYSATRERDEALAAVKARDKAAFFKKHPAGIYGVGMGMTRGNKDYEAWLDTPESKAIWNDAHEARKKYDARLRDLTEKARAAGSEIDRKLDEYQQDFMSQYAQITNAISNVSDAIDRKTAPPPPDPRTLPKNLWLWTMKNHYEVKVGETVPVWVKPIGGEGDYQLGFDTGPRAINEQAMTLWILGGGFEPRTLIPGHQAIPFHFYRAGTFTVTLVLSDKKGNIAREKLTFVVTEPPKVKEPTNEEVIEMLIPPKTAPVKPPVSPPPPVTPPAAPAWDLKPFAGTFRSQLWCPGLIQYPGGPYRDGRADATPIPVTITINTDGSVTGKSSHRAPDNLFSAVNQARWTTIEWKTQFTLEGTIDWKTGRMDLKIPNGVIDSFHEGPLVAPPGRDNGSRHRVERHTEFTAAFVGWHTGDPRWSAQMLGRVEGYSQGMGLAPDEHEKVGSPNITFDPVGGHHHFTDAGWFGTPGIDKSLSTANVPLKVDATKYVKPPGATIDNTKFGNLNAAVQAAGGGTWYLKLGEPEFDDNSLKGLELVATALWPDADVITVKAGRTVFAEFRGVYLDRSKKDLTGIVGPVDLSGRADWQVPAGLEQLAPGAFRAAQPGTYNVTARVRLPDGSWSSQTVKIVMTP